VPCPREVEDLLAWHASAGFWEETRLFPIVRRLGKDPLKQIKGTVHEHVVSETRRKDKIVLPDKHWGYRLARALEEHAEDETAEPLPKGDASFKHEYAEHTFR